MNLRKDKTIIAPKSALGCGECGVANVLIVLGNQNTIPGDSQVVKNAISAVRFAKLSSSS